MILWHKIHNSSNYLNQEDKMRKHLLATSAFVAASVVATGASAQSLEDRIRTLEESMLMGSPGSGFDVNISGYLHGGFFLVDIDSNPTLPAGSEEDYGSTDVKIGGTEVHFTATTLLDSGIEVGGRIELEGTTQRDQIDETYIWLEGGFGRMVLGAENGPSYLMHYSAPWVGGVSGADSPYYRYTVNNGAARTNTQTLLAGDANKITYFTPRFSGFQFGIGYTPQNSNRDGQANGWGSAYDRSGGTGVENIVAVAGNFSRDFGGVSVGASAGWESGSSNVKIGDQGVSDDPTNWHIGGEVARGGFTVGGAYYSATGFWGGDGTGSTVPYDAGEGNAQMAGVADASSDTEQTAWVVGARYSTGPWGVGIGYLQAERDRPRFAYADASATTATQTATSESLANSVINIAASYEAGPGVTVAADIGFYEDDVPATGGTTEAREAVGAGLILGISF